jgi:lipopolysaccharide/colanic/teichoic acid biosynthesis glycosyltransferase
MKQAGLSLLAKKVFDRTAGAALLAAASPILAVAAVAVRATMGSPVFFSQVRPGFKGKPFRIYKMRSMNDERDARGNLKPDEERLTKLGKFLRDTSIDELPQLYNVVRGDLSLVGPRPLLMQYLPLYSPNQARRHDVLPGITGWAQVRGRNARTWEIKFDYDLWYVDHWSLALDLRILFETVYRVLRREGISHPGFVTMPVFTGTTNGAAHHP